MVKQSLMRIIHHVKSFSTRLHSSSSFSSCPMNAYVSIVGLSEKCGKMQVLFGLSRGLFCSSLINLLFTIGLSLLYSDDVYSRNVLQSLQQKNESSRILCACSHFLELSRDSPFCVIAYILFYSPRLAAKSPQPRSCIIAMRHKVPILTRYPISGHKRRAAYNS